MKTNARVYQLRLRILTSHDVINTYTYKKSDTFVKNSILNEKYKFDLISLFECYGFQTEVIQLVEGR